MIELGLDNPKNGDVSPQVFYKKQQWYSVTIAPNDSSQYFKAKDRLLKFKNFWASQMVHLKGIKIEYRFNIELSEPRNLKMGSGGPRYHLHGRIMMKSDYSVFQFLENTLGQWNEFGIIDVDTIDDMDKWDQYCKKQEHIFKKYVPVITNME